MMVNKWDVDFWVEGRARSLIKSFYPTIVARDIELPLELVFERLMELSDDKKLLLKWEARCPECHYTINTFDDFPLVKPGDSLFCSRCHDEIEMDLDYIYPVFELAPAFRKSIRERDNQKKKSLGATVEKNRVLVPQA